jgi:hypothetical protein
MRVIRIPVKADMLFAEILLLVRSHLVDAYPVGLTPLIFAALQYLFAQRNYFFSSVKACEGLSILGFSENAAARALWHACQTTAVVFRNTVATSVCTQNMLKSILLRKSLESINVVDIAVALTV